ncbi:uncharacterized protein LOC129600726 [Paramacrobiotus metropolitanus]|uniref:uncharacterized protein LOC129600726 n=1 Tax=Paramacrobiotus metropolitanus TaxID=2943436 RepID=UPI0024463BB9|nr:uncharacterized protein LOC129600726 [Paramacrobiotus metropolitanus]
MCVLCGIPSHANWALGKELSSRAMNFSLPFPEDCSVPDGAEDIVDGTCMSWEDISRLSLIILVLMVLVGLRVYQLRMELRPQHPTNADVDWLRVTNKPAVSGNATPFKALGHPGK